MRRVLSGFIIATFVCATWLSGTVLAQSQSGDSLGDVARANRANQQAREATEKTPKMITNQDMSSDSQGIPEPSALDPMTTVSGVQKTNHYADQRLSSRLQAEQRTSAAWKARIQAQEDRIADLQAHIDRVNAAIHRSVGTAQYDTPANRYQAVQTERLAMMQDMLDLQKRKLAMMQDAARHAGMDQ
jgi:hypothetical protein